MDLENVNFWSNLRQKERSPQNCIAPIVYSDRLPSSVDETSDEEMSAMASQDGQNNAVLPPHKPIYSSTRSDSSVFEKETYLPSPDKSAIPILKSLLLYACPLIISLFMILAMAARNDIITLLYFAAFAYTLRNYFHILEIPSVLCHVWKLQLLAVVISIGIHLLWSLPAGMKPGKFSVLDCFHYQP